MKYNNKKNSFDTALSKFIMVIVVILFLCAAAYWSMKNFSYFQIATINLVNVHSGEPLKFVDKQKLFDAMKPYLSGSRFDLELDKAQEAARKFDWVSDVKIECTSLDTVTVTVREHEPVARWIRSNIIAGLVDGEGKVFQAAYKQRLPEFDGAAAVLPQMVSQYKSFITELKPLRLEILRLQYTPRASWSMMLNNGIELRLGKQEVNTRMSRFVNAWQYSLREKAGQLDYVDMRYPDGFATRNRRTAANGDNTAADKAESGVVKNKDSNNSLINRDE